MANDGKLVADSIEEMLVSLAEGVREAQESLNALAPFDSFNRPSPSYFIPYLDFELEVEIATDTNNAGRPIFKVMPLGAVLRGADSSSSSKSVTSSRISGRIIAVPPGEGLPIPQLALAAEKPAGNKVALSMVASNSAGEVLSGQRIELNIDMDGSKALSAGPNPTMPKARLQEAVLITDEFGQASTHLIVDSDGAQGRQLLVIATLGMASARVMVGTGGTA